MNYETVEKSKKTVTTSSIAAVLVDQIRVFYDNPRLEPRDIFSNYLQGSGTLLTKKGYELILPILSLHKITTPSGFNHRVTRSKILLARAMKYPYYVEKGIIWVSSAEDAFILTLHSGDINAWAAANGIEI